VQCGGGTDEAIAVVMLIGSVECWILNLPAESTLLFGASLQSRKLDCVCGRVSVPGAEPGEGLEELKLAYLPLSLTSPIAYLPLFLLGGKTVWTRFSRFTTS